MRGSSRCKELVTFFLGIQLRPHHSHMLVFILEYGLVLAVQRDLLLAKQFLDLLRCQEVGGERGVCGVLCVRVGQRLHLRDLVCMGWA